MRTQPQNQGSYYHHQPIKKVDQYCYSSLHILNNNMSPDHKLPPQTQISFQRQEDSYFTLESSTLSSYPSHESPPAASVSSSRTPLSSQEGSQSHNSDPTHNSCNNTHDSPVSNSSTSIVDDNEILDLKQLLIRCAEAISNGEFSKAVRMTETLEHMVSVSGEPFQRLAAYALEGLRAKLLSSGNIIYKKLKCDEPITSSEMMSYMSVLYHICPYYKFAYTSANIIIMEATRNENRIHIIDFCIAQGSQWMDFIKMLAKRPNGPPSLRLTGVDDSDSFHARGGGMDIVGTRLKEVADSCKVPFEFHSAGMSGCDVELERLGIRTGEAIAVNFPYMLHHMPDESVNTWNHRDRLIRLVKSLSPKVMTLVEQESNTNTSHFVARFCETLDYYNAMFESIEAGCPKDDDKRRIKTEEHCVARDIVSIIACEGEERVQRHELFGKWKARLMMAGFSPCQLNPYVSIAVKEMLKREFSPNFKTAEMNGALYLGWKNRAMATCSAWR
ncbi:scarecrow-like protein 13 [Impatiens glandulifera]|uniref:scarecrow-like protein 13 n=1 Tax=Impatiens glandulifera TaxID=253017 RepID=UPI001FB0EA37|nr:scarecrow-like protein 13 [Impatiens glandulifera]XP_047318350.1 scarecrow-like protein 13 [Impatiens glandulifera]